MGDWKNRLVLRLGPPLAAALFKAVYKTCHIEVFGQEYYEQLVREGRPIICVLWHFSLLYCAYRFRDRGAVAMVSASKDGELMARTMQRFGYTTVRGSRGKGGLAAVKEITGLIRSGLDAGIVADGSQGPPQAVQKGVIILARETGSPILPVTHATKGAIRFNSWDKTVLSLPFSRLAFFYGEPLFVPGTARGPEVERYRQELEDRMNGLVKTAEDYMAREEDVRRKG